MAGRSLAYRLILGFGLAIVHLPALCSAQQNDPNADRYAAYQDTAGCPRLKLFPPLPMAVVESCDSGNSVGVTVPLKPDANGFAQEKQVRGIYEFREYRIPGTDQQESAFNNLMTLIPIAGFRVLYSVKPSMISARNGDTWMLVNVSSETYNVSIVRAAPEPWTPVKTAEEISKKMSAHNRVDIYGIEFSRENEAIQEKPSQVLFEILKFLNQNPNLSVVIESHKVSTTGSPNDDSKITRVRANAVMDWLVEHGIARSRLQAKPFDRKSPPAENDTPTALQQNEWIVLQATN